MHFTHTLFISEDKIEIWGSYHMTLIQQYMDIQRTICKLFHSLHMAGWPLWKCSFENPGSHQRGIKLTHYWRACGLMKERGAPAICWRSAFHADQLHPANLWKRFLKVAILQNRWKISWGKAASKEWSGWAGRNTRLLWQCFFEKQYYYLAAVYTDELQCANYCEPISRREGSACLTPFGVRMTLDTQWPNEHEIKPDYSKCNFSLLTIRASKAIL